MYSGCPVLCCSNLQTKIAIGATKAEYIALSQVMRNVLCLTDFLKEVFNLQYTSS